MRKPRVPTLAEATAAVEAHRASRALRWTLAERDALRALLGECAAFIARVLPEIPAAEYEGLHFEAESLAIAGRAYFAHVQKGA